MSLTEHLFFVNLYVKEVYCILKTVVLPLFSNKKRLFNKILRPPNQKKT